MSRKPRPRAPLDPAMRAWCEQETVRLLPLVTRLAQRSGLPLPIEDLVQEGAQAVFEALPRFDPSRGAKVESWLLPRIVGAMQDYARQMGRLLKGGARTGRRESLVSLDKTCYQTDDGKPVTGAELLPDRPLARRRSGADWASLLKGFSVRERIIVLQYFEAGKTMHQIGDELGLSESRVSQSMTEIVARMRELDASEGRVREFAGDAA